MDRREHVNNECGHEINGRMAGVAIIAAISGLIWLVIGLLIGRGW